MAKFDGFGRVCVDWISKDMILFAISAAEPVSWPCRERVCFRLLRGAGAKEIAVM